jgi:hypothetical protein
MKAIQNRTVLLHRTLILLAAFAVSTIALAGCTPGSSNTSTGGGSTQPNPAPTKTYSEADARSLACHPNAAREREQ